MLAKLDFDKANQAAIKQLNPKEGDRKLELPDLESQTRRQDSFHALLHRSRAQDAGRNLNLVRCFD